MTTIDLAGLVPAVARKIAPMLDDMLQEHAPNIHSIHIVGSAVIPDYNEKVSDINSLVLLRDMDLRFLTFLAPLGKKYGRQRIAAPLVMTPEYVQTSLDAFPIEFLDFKLIHRRQGYISSLGKKERLAEILVRSITGSMALFRAVIFLVGAEPPVPRSEVVMRFGAASSVETDIFEKLLLLKAKSLKPSEEEVRSLFTRYYSALESVGKTLDELPPL
jgi:hypothetical protein